MLKKFVALVVLVTGSWQLAGTAVAAPGGTNLPFSATGSGSVTGTLTSTLTGTVTGTHLGSGSFAGSAVSNGVAFCGSGSASADISLNLTAADGSVISVVGTDQVCWDISHGFTFPFTGSYTIIGGTGRFANATGSGTFSGVTAYPSFPNGTISYAMKGTINLNEPSE